MKYVQSVQSKHQFTKITAANNKLPSERFQLFIQYSESVFKVKHQSY